MSGLIVSLPPWAANNSLLDGVAREFFTLPAATRAVRLDARLNTASVAAVTVTVTDGTSSIVLTIPGGTLHASVAQTVTLGPGAISCQTDGADAGAGFSGSLWLEEIAAMPAGVVGTGLVSLDDLKGALGIASATATEDAWLTRQIDVFSWRIRAYCNRHFNLRRYLERFERPDSVLVREAPIATVHSLTAGGLAVTPSTLRLDLEVGRISPPAEESTPLWTGYDPVVIDYEAGWDPVPPDVAELVYTGIGKRWSAFRAGSYTPEPEGLVKRETVADAGTVEFAMPSSSRLSEFADYLLGIPLSSLDHYVRPLHSTGVGDSLSTWELAP